MNTCYYYQDLLPRSVRELSPAPFNPAGVSALLVYSMIAQDTCLHALSGDSVWYGYTGLTSSIFRATSFGW